MVTEYTNHHFQICSYIMPVRDTQVIDSATSMKRLDSMTRTRSANNLNVPKPSVTRSGSDEALGNSSSKQQQVSSHHLSAQQHRQQAQHAQQAQQEAVAYTHGGQANPPPLGSLTSQGSRGLAEGPAQKGPRVNQLEPRAGHVRKSSLEDSVFDSDDSSQGRRQVSFWQTSYSYFCMSQNNQSCPQTQVPSPSGNKLIFRTSGWVK